MLHSMKGWEIWSWQTPDSTWCFSLLVGTNRNKLLAEIVDPKDTIVGIPALKGRLAQLAPNEGVCWCMEDHDIYNYNGRLSYQSEAEIQDIANYARQHNLRFHGPSHTDLQNMTTSAKQHKPGHELTKAR